MDIERIRQELPQEVSIFEAIDFRICAQYGNGALSKQEYHAFTEQIIPAYEKNPPAKTASNSACGPSFTTKRLASEFVPQWKSLVNRLRTERNVHDLQNLIEINGRIPVGLTAKDLIQEAHFTLSCLAEKGVTNGEARYSWKILGRGF